MTGADARILLVPLDEASGVPLYRQVYEHIREAIFAERLPPGVRLPSTRTLATELHVSRNTVLLAYEQLSAEGFLEGRVGAGTRVARRLAGLLASAPPAAKPARALRVASRVEALRGVPYPIPRKTGTSMAFAVAQPDTSLFPVSVWQRLERTRQRELPGLLGLPIDPAGYRPLREAIAVYVGAARGIAAAPDQIVVVAGAQQALDVAARTLLDIGDVAGVEDPGYPGSVGAFLSAGAIVTRIPVDEHGLVTAHLQRANPRVMYCSPSHQFPLGVALSLERRIELLSWADRSEAWILEDDYDSEYRYAGQPITALGGLQRASDRVVYIGTFSKVLSPALRMGFVVLPVELVEPFTRVRVHTDLGPPLLEQVVLADFIAQGHFARHLQRTRRLYRSRLDHLLECAAASLGDRLRLQPDAAGMRIVGWLPPHVNDMEVAAAAEAAGVTCLPLSMFYHDAPARPGLLLGFAATNEAAIDDGVRRLARVLRDA